MSSKIDNTNKNQELIDSSKHPELIDNSTINYHQLIHEYTFSKKGKYLKKSKIKVFLERLFGITYNLASNIFSRDASKDNNLFTNIYTQDLLYNELFSPNIIWIIFPQHNLRIFCSENVVLDISGINGIYKGQFSEKPIQFKYYCPKTNKVWDSPKMIIPKYYTKIYDNATHDLEKYLFQSLSEDNLYQQIIKTNNY